MRRWLLLPLSMIVALLPTLGPTPGAQATVITISGTGPTPAGLAPTLTSFRTAIGGANNFNSGSTSSGRREINWDGVPAAFDVPNGFPGGFFNNRGANFNTPGTGLAVSSDTVPANERFGNINASYPAELTTNSAPRLFTALGSPIVDVTFTVPGTSTAAATKAFGVVFVDVDTANESSVEVFDANGISLGIFSPPALDKGLSFLGIQSTTPISRLRIKAGTTIGAADAPGHDIVVMDDFIYGEPFVPAAVSVLDTAVPEGNSGSAPASFTVSLSAPTQITTTVDYFTSDGTAVAPGDYVAVTGTITFPPGTTSQSILVPIVGDKAAEADETFSVTLANPTNLTIARATAAGTIVNDDHRVFLFAEGTTRPGFYEELDLANTLPSAITVQVTYQYSQDTPHPPLQKSYPVPAHSTVAIDVGGEAGIGNDVSLRVEETGAVAGGLVAERQLYFDYTSRGPDAPHWTGLHDQVGVAGPASTWYFGEGTTLPDFTEFLTVQNPDPNAAAVVQLTYQPDRCDGPAPSPKTLTLTPSSRTTVRVSDPSDPNGAEGVSCVGLGASLKVTSGPAIVAERPLYFAHDFGSGQTSDGHDSFGAVATAAEFYFAEGTTLPGFDEFLTFADPGTTAADVTIDYADQAGVVTTKRVTVPAGERTTVRVGDPASPGGLTGNIEGVSAHVLSTQPIVAERPIYVVRDFGAGVVTGGHDAQGATSLATFMAFADGATAPGFDTFVTILNPDPSLTAHITLTFLGPTGKIKDVPGAVPPHTRSTFRLSDPALVGPGVADPIGIEVIADIGIVAERPEYVTGTIRGLDISGAADAVGFPG